MSVPEQPPSGNLEEFWCKNRLQEFAQKASISLPVYQTVSEGTKHAPHFRSRVWVDGTCFESSNTFSSKKMAEQDAAKLALIGIREKLKNEGPLRILEDTVFCKSIINEYISKMNLKPGTYVTNESKAFIPMFVSSLELNGVTYVGHAGKNKKEAEQFAARSAILSILAIFADSESDTSHTTMSEIVKSKFKLYDALKTVKDSSGVQGSTVPAGVNQSEDFKGSYSVKRDNVPGAMNPLGEIRAIQEVLPECTIEQHSRSLVRHQSLHQFKKPESQTSSAAIAPPIACAIEFVPPASEQAQICPTSGKKRKRKNKAKKEVQNQSP
ncbi:hypothetical protein DH2020_012480 [Rehmannia glutinosa]|uniref:DRBM domain-containing protein n=1 Tax=Rehmannia glutinosa TaxID=99300 RepID=A0ABR0WZW6_REHGL